MNRPPQKSRPLPPVSNREFQARLKLAGKAVQADPVLKAWQARGAEQPGDPEERAAGTFRANEPG